ncbi:uncharacterized protein BJ171DRAFT_566670 [Polychytrium aggregatum]|uniref:uncharacterized protein n=1 Tax=Polychytrium aggregatum TaxID=110093 RepID=UPI0022FE2102|nr:uncharacterized protein BJ171DRAFT_566670 [Polychytrium aggregatum]KAI9206314.1 hypothetical protein BJ171DRAFT_566670 [Polychytrium aggregatum]
MSSKVSSAKGKRGAKKSGQKHQNTFAFTVSKHSYIQQKIAAAPISGLCRHCVEILQWRKRMNKYKPLTQPKKCVKCNQKSVTEAYHIICNKCAADKKVCAKCQQSQEIVNDNAPTPQEILKSQQDHDRLLGSMNERQRRSYMRKIERGDEDGANKISQTAANAQSDDDFDLDDFDGMDDDFDDDGGDGLDEDEDDIEDEDEEA